MIKAIIFDLDGTLVQTEILKAHSYGKALAELSKNSVREEQVIKSFKLLVGLSRKEVARRLIEQFGKNINTDYSNLIQKELAELLIKHRLKIYHEMLSDPLVLPKHSCEYNIGLLKTAIAKELKTGLATMSYCEQVKNVLKILELENHFNYIITRDEVNHPKPDPEIYLKMLEKLEITNSEAIIIEDSVSGIQAAQAAGVTVFAVTNSLTEEKVKNSRIIDSKFIINNRPNLNKRIFSFISRNAG
ncbi:phosphorylated carbohydrates phosphatase [bacterium BMS3Abin03]|nr:phosphorylated carbohydrates phosphatase [bacterium BMS3Abin03]HDZ59151.1 HAD family hydrolase [Ignavibacteriales bacterium]